MLLLPVSRIGKVQQSGVQQLWSRLKKKKKIFQIYRESKPIQLSAFRNKAITHPGPLCTVTQHLHTCAASKGTFTHTCRRIQRIGEALIAPGVG